MKAKKDKIVYDTRSTPTYNRRTHSYDNRPRMVERIISDRFTLDTFAGSRLPVEFGYAQISGDRVMVSYHYDYSHGVWSEMHPATAERAEREIAAAKASA